MSGNPFRFNRPARASRFFGRNEVVEEIIDDLHDSSGDSYAIVGGRRFGKSSLLLTLQDKLIGRLAQAENKAGLVLPIFVSLKAAEPTSSQHALGLALHSLKRATCGAKGSDPMKRGPLLDLGLPEYAEVNPRPTSLQELESAVETCVEAAYRKFGVESMSIVLLIDEADYVVDFPWTIDLFGMLRSLIYDGPVCEHARLILAGSGRYLAVHENGSPLINVCKPYFLEPFTKEAALELINSAPSISEIVAEEVFKQGGGHPFILQYLLHYLIASGMMSATAEAVDAEVRRFVHERSPDLEGWWHAIEENGQRIYHILAERMDWMTHAEVAEAASDPNLQLDRGLNALCYHGLIAHDGTYKKFHVSGLLFQTWAASRNIAYSGNVQPGNSLPHSQSEAGHSAEFKDVSERYIDFDLHVAPSGRVTANSPEGQASADISVEVPNSIRLSLGLIENRQTNADLLKQLGQELYDWLFPGPIHTHFHQTEAVIRQERAKLRLRLRIEADSIASLPLEFIYRAVGGYFLAANPDTVLSRYLNLPQPSQRVRLQEGPLHLLVIISDPIDQVRLDPDEWESLLHDALTEPLSSGQITVRTVKRATRKEIGTALLEQQPNIIQFVGHGVYQHGKGHLALVDEDTGGTWMVDDERFANLYLGFKERLGLISLATCESGKSDNPQGFSGIAPQLVERGVPAVVAMQYKVYVKTAKIFLEEFYASLAARKPADWATQRARNAISLQFGLNDREFATPVLYMRAKDGDVL